ncbi:MAG: L,D-transpeptidase family protein [Thermoleophilia bacterium]
MRTRWTPLLALAAVTAAFAAQPATSPAASSPQWPVPVPSFFWDWARWYLHRGPHADEPLRSPASRPAEAPARIPAWAWRRVRVMLGQELSPAPAQPLGPGSGGPDVRRLQRTLATIGFPAGPVDGVYGERTRAAVVAYEKLQGLERDGRVDAVQYRSILRASRPAAPLAQPATYVYVDLGRQVLLDVRDGRVAQVIAISSGGSYPYTGLDGREHVARTPTGSFRVQRKVAGWDESYLGRLYYPLYFQGGYAIHGSTSVPIEPVSHGCVRIPIWLAQAFFQEHGIGTRVVVVGPGTASA